VITEKGNGRRSWQEVMEGSRGKWLWKAVMEVATAVPGEVTANPSLGSKR
jgi:hypothetical protein